MDTDGTPDDEPNERDDAVDRSRWQFSLQSLMMATAVFAAIMGLAKVSPLLAYLVVGGVATLATRGVRPLHFAVPFLFSACGNGYWLVPELLRGLGQFGLWDLVGVIVIWLVPTSAVLAHLIDFGFRLLLDDE